MIDMFQIYAAVILLLALVLVVSALTIFGAFLLLRDIWRALKRLFKKKKGPTKKEHRATRHERNPLIEPDALSEWEAIGTFNPAAYLDEEGKVHLLYRALGSDGVSRIGYALSSDGFSIDERLPYAPFAMTPARRKGVYDPVMYPSGGSWGGTEDPRMCEIDGRIYLTFNAFDGWDFIRIGVSSISKDDFLAKRWNWSKPLLISPAGEIHKNWVLFPEKIDGKFAILHSITPHVQIEYVDRLESLAHGSARIRSIFKQGKSEGMWESKVRGAGPPPIKTDKGWLLLYHATDDKEPHKYQLGAMLLDSNNPEKVIARAPNSLIIPEMWYENDWKPGIVYACGAVIKDDLLYIYYGGGDKHVCVAHTDFGTFINWLIHYGKV